MPNLTVEYSANTPGFDAPLVLQKLNRVLAASGHFNEVDIKSRALRFDVFAIGTAPEKRAFVHAKLSLLKGRSVEIRTGLSQSLLVVLQESCGAADGVQTQLCVEVLEIDPETYVRANIG